MKATTTCVKDNEAYIEAIRSVLRMREEMGTLIKKALDDCRALVEETEREKLYSKTLLEEAKVAEAIAKAAYEASIGTPAEPEAFETYEAAKKHRKKMETRYEMAEDCVRRAIVREEKARSAYLGNQRHFDETVDYEVGRMRKAHAFIDEYLNVHFPDVSIANADKTDDSRVPMNKGQDGSVVFVFSCPGQDEEASGQVCHGNTGTHLDYLVGFLNDGRPDVFKYRERYMYGITNASDKVHYEAKTGDSEASDSEIASPANIARLSAELKDVKYIICMGSKAEYAVNLAGVTGKKIIGEHLSLQHLNRSEDLKVSDKLDSHEKTLARIKLIAEKILAQI